MLREDNKHRWRKELRAGGEPASWFLATVHSCMIGCNYPLTNSCWYPQSGEVSIQLVSRTRSGAIRALTCAFPPVTFLQTLWLTVWFYLCPVEVCVCLEVGFRHIGKKKKNPNLHFSRWLHFPRDFILLAENQIRIVSVASGARSWDLTSLFGEISPLPRINFSTSSSLGCSVPVLLFSSEDIT